jgi:hypothetical protein
MNKYNSFLLGVLCSGLFFGYVLTYHFVSKQFVLSEKFYMDGAFYKLERVRK